MAETAEGSGLYFSSSVTASKNSIVRGSQKGRDGGGKWVGEAEKGAVPYLTDEVWSWEGASWNNLDQVGSWPND